VSEAKQPESPLAIDRPALEALAALLLDRAGLKITPDGYYGLRLALQARMPALGLSDAQDYVRRLRQLAGEHELRSLLPLVTVGKTEFFRDTRQFTALEQVILPELLTFARTEGRPLRIWSAGCATGEEPYSVAMLCHELGAKRHEFDVWATDLNPAAIETAIKGHFPVRRMVGLTEERIGRWFTLVGNGYQAVPALRTSVRFEAMNLAAPVFHTVDPGALDLILCRNVIIYFAQPTIQTLMEKFYDALRVGGVLLLGYSESLFKLYARFEMFEVTGSFAYRRPSQVPRPRLDLVVPPRAAPPPSAPVPRGKSPSRPLTPIGEGPAPDASPPGRRPRTPEERLAEIAALLEKGQFPQALLAARRFTDEHPEDLSARLTLGNVHALMGDLDLSRDAFHTALAEEPLCVEARLYLALAALQAKEPKEAKTELTRALFLEPSLALGHYLLGQVNEQLGDVQGARRSYKNAVALKRSAQRALLGHYPELPGSADAIAQAAQYRVAALEER
jgi:chemotaxis protein methyltransferase CheR